MDEKMINRWIELRKEIYDPKRNGKKRWDGTYFFPHVRNARRREMDNIMSQLKAKGYNEAEIFKRYNDTLSADDTDNNNVFHRQNIPLLRRYE